MCPEYLLYTNTPLSRISSKTNVEKEFSTGQPIWVKQSVSFEKLDSVQPTKKCGVTIWHFEIRPPLAPLLAGRGGRRRGRVPSIRKAICPLIDPWPMELGPCKHPYHMFIENESLILWKSPKFSEIAKNFHECRLQCKVSSKRTS